MRMNNKQPSVYVSTIRERKERPSAFHRGALMNEAQMKGGLGGHKNPPAQDESILVLPSSLNSCMSPSVGSVYMCFSKWPRQ